MTQPLAGLRILVVEDEYLIAAELEEAMTKLGAEVVGPVGRLEPALELARGNPLDGAILDVKLAAETSSSIAQELMARGVPVVLCSGYEPEQMPESLRHLPTIRKPFSPNSFEAALRRTFKKQAGAD
jgi:DNA-binding response OmpR family regulator